MSCVLVLVKGEKRNKPGHPHFCVDEEVSLMDGLSSIKNKREKYRRRNATATAIAAALAPRQNFTSYPNICAPLLIFDDRPDGDKAERVRSSRELGSMQLTLRTFSTMRSQICFRGRTILVDRVAASYGAVR